MELPASMIVAAIVLVGASELPADAREVMATITHYCPCRRCCGPDAKGITSTGKSANSPGAAVDPKAIPYGSKIVFSDGSYVRADDTGGSMRQAWRKHRIIHIDVRCKTHADAKLRGVYKTKVRIER